MKKNDNIFSKVLFVAPDDKYGGIGAVMRTYAKHMKWVNCIATYPSIPIKSKLLFFLLAIAQVTKVLLLDKRIQIIHLHSASYGSFIRKSIIALIGKVFGKKIIFHMHGGSFNKFYDQARIFKPIIRGILKNSDAVICLSPKWHEYYTRHIGISQVVTVANPVELSMGVDCFRISPVLKLLFLGKICDDKGIFNLIEYLRTNKYFLDNKVQLAIGGVGEESRLISTISTLSNNSKIEYYGWADEVQKKQLLEDCDIFILPSKYEGLPVSILEAMAYRKPIIASDVGGISSIVHVGYNGWLLDPNDLTELDDIFDEIFSERPLLHSYGLNSYREASKYSSTEVVKSLSLIYESLCVK